MLERIFPLGDKSFWKRLYAAYFLFFILLGISFLVGFFLLPEGSMKKLPLPVFQLFTERETFLKAFLKTSIFNLLGVLFIMLMNLYRVKRFSFGYLVLYVNTINLGLFAGTNSFSGPVSSHSLAGCLLFLRIGFVEFSAYILAAVSTVNLAMFHADKWRGENFRKIRSPGEIHLQPVEKVALLMAFTLIIIAAINEWLYIL